MNIETALESAREYCRSHGYDASKVDEMYKQTISGELYIAYFPNVDTDGLTNDMGTQAVPVLVVSKDYTVIEMNEADNVLRRDAK